MTNITKIKVIPKWYQKIVCLLGLHSFTVPYGWQSYCIYCGKDAEYE